MAYKYKLLNQVVFHVKENHHKFRFSLDRTDQVYTLQHQVYIFQNALWEYVYTATDNDVVFVDNNVTVVVDPKSLPIIDGITVDYVRQGLNEGFEFVNSAEKDRCGCGESFRI